MQQGEETQCRRVQDASAETVRIAGTMDSKPNVPRLLRRHNASDVSSSRRITERVVVITSGGVDSDTRAMRIACSNQQIA